MKSDKEERTKKSKAKACLFAGASTTIFTRDISPKKANDIWDYLHKRHASV